jgi:DNA-binding CsgD family transcriptional regulator/pimeloyl-ACP methyl ester carboxylesterase
MDAPPVQYVTTSDGMRIAYGVSGRGTPLLFLPGVAFYHVQLGWEYPRLQGWLRGLSERFQLIQLDPRGFGMSSREVSEDLARQDYQKDMEAVVGRLRPGRFLIVAASTGVDLALDYTLQHPQQIIGLVLGTSGVDWRWSTALFDILPTQDWDAFLYSIAPRDRSREERERIVELRRQSWDQRNYVLQSRVMYGRPDAYAVETRDLLSRLRTPTLVLHARDYALIPVEQGMKKAEITGGHLVLIDGTDVWGDANQGLHAIETFLATLPAYDGPPASGDGLSAREIEVLRLIAAGRSNQQIADELVISLNTVQHHVSSILTKTGVANRTEAAAYAHRNNLI